MKQQTCKYDAASKIALSVYVLIIFIFSRRCFFSKFGGFYNIIVWSSSRYYLLILSMIPGLCLHTLCLYVLVTIFYCREITTVYNARRHRSYSRVSAIHVDDYLNSTRLSLSAPICLLTCASITLIETSRQD